MSSNKIFVYGHELTHQTLSNLDVGQVWGWGYGGEGQLGLGTRIKTVATPHLIPCIDQPSKGKDSSATNNQESVAFEKCKSLGTYVKEIACGGRHSTVVTGNSDKMLVA